MSLQTLKTFFQFRVDFQKSWMVGHELEDRTPEEEHHLLTEGSFLGLSDCIQSFFQMPRQADTDGVNGFIKYSHDMPPYNVFHLNYRVRITQSERPLSNFNFLLQFFFMAVKWRSQMSYALILTLIDRRDNQQRKRTKNDKNTNDFKRLHILTRS